MAVFGSAFSSVNRNISGVPSCCCHPVKKSFRFGSVSCTFPRHRRAQGPFKQRHILPHQRCLLLRAQAAGDIALPGPGGQSEEIVLPEPGLINPSILNSEYDREITGLAIPALGSILLDPFLSLVDTGKILQQCKCFHNVPMYHALSKRAHFCVNSGSFGWAPRICTAGSCGTERRSVWLFQLPVQLPHGGHHSACCFSSSAE